LSDALVEAAGLWEKARIAETGNMDSGNQLRATLGRAATLAASELADPILVARVQTLQENLSQDEKDRRILARLEDIHFEKVARPDGVDHWRTAYEAAFADYGLPISEFLSGAAREEQFEETARRIAASPIRDRLVAALDDCAQSIELCQRLLPIARRVEEKNPWRLQYFDARIRNDVAALLRLGRQPEALTQPPSMIVSVAETLRVTGHDNLSAARLLREAQLLYPADVGIVRRLALVIVFSDGEYRARDELIGLSRTALAARPDDHDRFVHARLAT